MPHTENDNEGRRKGLRNALSNDPFYRRVKDASLVLLAFWAASSNFIDWKSIFKKNEPVPTVRTEAQARIWERLNASEQATAVIQVTLRNLENGQNDIKQDVRELLRQVGRSR